MPPVRGGQTRGSGRGTVVLGLLGLLALALVVFHPGGSLLGKAQAAPAGARSATLLVLGAAQYNGHPSPLFRARLDVAARLYRVGGVARVVVSGGVGDGDRFSEGAVGRGYLVSRGLPPTRVLAETRSRSTLENLCFSRSLLGSGPLTLVTDEVHAPRAAALAQALGIEATVASATVRHYGEGYKRYLARESLASAALALLGARC